MKFLVPIVAATLLTSCASLLMLPDEQTEAFYEKNAGITKDQITKNMTASTGAKITVADKGNVRIMPIIYAYTTYNSLKQNEEVYYTSRLTNHAWFRDFMLTAHKAVLQELKTRGIDASYYNSGLEGLSGGKDIERVYRTGESRRGTPLQIAAFNENPETNYGFVDKPRLRSHIGETDKGVVLVEFDVDWIPSSANTMNGDIVLNTALVMGFDLTICGADGCSNVNVPFSKGIRASLFMPNKNTIDDDGLSKNFALLKKLHGEHIKQIVAAAFERFDAQGVFVK